jgi:uncharacterized protein YutE (UPF0331/DUF86 family)
LANLRTIQETTSRQQYLNNRILQSAVERNLQVAIQCLLDIGNHIIAEDELGTPEANEDIFRILCDAKIIPADFANQIKGISGLRNMLIYQYLEIDATRVYGYVESAIDDFEQFAKFIVDYLQNLC